MQRLHLQRILQHRAPEHLRREIRDAGEGQLLAFGEGIADVDGAVVVQADDVAGIGLLHRRAVAGHEGQRIGHAHFLAQARMVEAHARRIAPRAHAHEGDAVAVARIHVRLDLEHEAGELRLVRLHHALARRARLRRRRIAREAAQQFLDAEVADRRAEEHRRLPAGEVCLQVERRGRAAHQLHFVAEGRGAIAQEFAWPRRSSGPR